jgi:alpha-tubulin suppressor-like RCC1 family protein/serine/threonine protein kinase
VSNEGAATQITPEIRLVRCLGRGGMGAVWLAEHTKLGTNVVVKLLDEVLGGAAPNETSRARFIREAEAAAQVRSPHVVQIFDFGISDAGAPYIVMELLDGRDLGFELRAAGVLAPKLVAHVLSQVATALEVVHARRIVHRDIKPGNIFLCRLEGAPESELPFVKLLDFGIAKLTAHAEVTLTTTGEMIGTPLYMSPEQFESSATIDHLSDLWSLGVVAFRALTGKPPFRGETLGQVVASVLNHEMPVPTRLRPELPRGVDAWFAKACARVPQERFTSAREMANAFAKAIETEPFGVGLAPLPGTTSVPPPTQGSLTALGSTVTDPATEAHEEQKRHRTGLFAALAAAALLVGLFATGWRSGARTPPKVGDVGERSLLAPANATSSVKFVGVGRSHTCAIMPDGSLRCWGSNLVGALGIGDDPRPRLVPTPVPGLSNVVYVSLGLYHTCAATLDGSVYCWGSNTRGQIGDGTTETRHVPVLVRGLGPARKVQCGDEHSCAEMKDGTAVCWGSNVHGELGNGTKVDLWSPTLVRGVSGIRKLSVGAGRHACAALTNGSVVCWGSNSHGQLGARVGADSATPVAVEGLPLAAKVFVGVYHSCALMADGTVQCWGANGFGQLGDGTIIQRETPVPVPGLANVDSLGSGWRTTCAALSNGSVACWGSNDHGQLGLGRMHGYELSPVAVPGLRHAGGETSIKGGDHVCTLAEDGALRCWGWNDVGQLGDGTKEDRATPVVVKL